MDITTHWTDNNGKTGSVSERRSYTVNGVAYVVDGHHIVLNHSEHEKAVAHALASKYGKHVELVPTVNYPGGIQTPDYLIDGARYDLKSPTGQGKYLLKGMVARKERQAPNFILDITNCPLSLEEIERQINTIFASRQTEFVEKIVVMKNLVILKVHSRK